MVLIRKHTWIILALLLVWPLAFSRPQAQEPCKPVKKVSRVIQDLFGEDHEILPLQISADRASLPESYHRGDCVFSIRQGEQVRGYLISTRAKGRYENFDYSVIFSEQFTVMKVLVTVYRSTHGAAISQKQWLSQFEGYQGGKLELGSDIDAVSGGTLSAISMLEDIQRCHLLISTLEAGNK